MGELDLGVDLELRLSTMSKDLDHVRRKLDQWAAPLWRSLGSISGIAAANGGPIVFNLGSPPAGYYWKVRAIQATGPTVTAIASVNVDVYVASQGNPGPGSYGTLAGLVPSVADWYTSSSTSAAPGSLPVEIAPSGDEMSINSGDSLIVVLTGAGVTTAVDHFTVGGFVHQYQGFDGLRRHQSG